MGNQAKSGNVQNGRRYLSQTRTWKQEIKHSWPLYVLLLPAVILAVSFKSTPIFYITAFPIL